MKRKVVRHGSSTLTISLPKKWTGLHGIGQGDELEVVQKGPSLMIGSDLKPAIKKISINLTGTGKLLHRTIAAIYKSGFDKVTIQYGSSDELELIQDTVYRYCHVFEITKISKNQVDIQSISNLTPTHLDEMLIRMQKSIMEIGNTSLQGIKSNDYEALSQIILKDKMVDRYCAFGSRIINKGWELDYPPGPLYLILDQTEIAADIFKVINQYVIDNKPKISSKIISFLSEIIEFMSFQFNLINDLNMHKLRQLSILELSIKQQIDFLCGSEKQDIKLLVYITDLFETVFEMKSAIICLNICKAKDLKDTVSS